MNPTPFAFEDFVRAKQALRSALLDNPEPFTLLTGETGSGKTALLRELRSELDRAHHRVLYFSEARKLGAAGLVKVLAETLRLRPAMCHAVNFERILRALAEEPQAYLLWLDEAQDLPEETLAEARALAESHLELFPRLQIFLVGLPKLRTALQTQPALWRRIAVRVELTGLRFEELTDFLDHHFEHDQRERLCDQGLHTLFERAKGVPGLLLPMARTLFRQSATDNAPIEPRFVEETLERWELA